MRSIHGPLPAFLLTAFAVGVVATSAAATRRARPPTEVEWTLVAQMPPGRTLRVDRSSGTVSGAPARVIPRVRRGSGGFLALSRVTIGTVSVESSRIRVLQQAGSVLVITVSVPARKRVRAVSTNMMPLSEDPGHQTFVNLQLVAEGMLHARASFAVVDNPGRTAVLFQ